MQNSIVLEKQAAKFLEHLQDARLSKRLERVISQLRENAHPHNALKIQGLNNAYRIRVGDYRLIYQIQQNFIIITIIEHRGNVYELMRRIMFRS